MGLEAFRANGGWLGIGIIIIVLCVLVGVSWGQSRFPGGGGYTAGPGAPWIGDWIPYVSAPSGTGKPSGNWPNSPNNYFAYAAPSGFGQCGYTNQAGWGKFPAMCPTGVNYTWLDTSKFPAVCGGGYNGLLFYLCYVIKSGDSSTKDFDNDTIKDNVDTTPDSPDDTDGDGLHNGIDPWPNDNTKPGNHKYRLMRTYVRTSDGATIKVYGKEGDELNAGFWWYVTTGGATLGDLDGNPNNYRVTVEIGGRGKTFAEWNVGSAAGGGTNAGGTSQSTTNTGVNTGGATGGDSGSRAPADGSTNDYKVMFDYLQGIQRNTKNVASNTETIIDQNNRMSTNQVQTNLLLSELVAKQGQGGEMGGVESRLDTANSNITSVGGKIDNAKNELGNRIDTTNSKLEDIKAKLGNLGDTNQIGDISTSAMENNSDLSDEENQIKIDAETASLTSFMDGLLYQSNPIKNIVTGSGVTYSGASSSLGVSAGPFNFSLNFGGMESQLSLMGIFFASFCGLAGIVEFIRG